MPQPDRSRRRSTSLVVGVAALLCAALIGASPVSGTAAAVPTNIGARPVAAEVTAQSWIRPGREVDLTIDSPALGSEAAVKLLLPRDWSPTATRTWPVLYLLHGCCEASGHTVWTRMTDVEQQVEDRDVIVVMPAAGWAGFYSNWRNHGLGGGPQWEDFHLTELREIVERDFLGGQRRAVAGLSMGGFGALSYAARHPGMFQAAASFSGVVHTLMDLRGPLLTSGLVLSGGSAPTAVWGDPLTARRVWAEHNPYDLADRLTGLPVYISSGNGRPGPLDASFGLIDPLESPIGDMNRRLVERLRQVGADVTAHLYGAGTHTWPYWQRELELALPLLLEEIGA
ncbi:putative esterase [Aeromicrobium marinum DSM 15272]|uniref:Esterase n=1 Tax=Aeromicrobium marinum DSM 15272 TaxID=585531 RepID=E2SCC8_9ACTN|nr:alpha/beta hydrolase family protein [Aeromicrobium marinum]EFQ82881.1 putative esterase [Aeromicrobium marinum DSM 15272]